MCSGFRDTQPPPNSGNSARRRRAVFSRGDRRPVAYARARIDTPSSPEADSTSDRFYACASKTGPTRLSERGKAVAWSRAQGPAISARDRDEAGGRTPSWGVMNVPQQIPARAGRTVSPTTPMRSGDSAARSSSSRSRTGNRRRTSPRHTGAVDAPRSTTRRTGPQCWKRAATTSGDAATASSKPR